jgi:hypothetical protein
MAYLLHIHTTDAGNAGLVPDSLADSAWATSFADTNNNYPKMTTESNGCVVFFFENETELDAYFGGTKVPAEHQAAVDAWKTANSITMTYTLYDLSGSALDISDKEKY